MGAGWAGLAGLGWLGWAGLGWAGGYRQTFQLWLFPLQLWLWRDTAEMWIDTNSGVKLGSKSYL